MLLGPLPVSGHVVTVGLTRAFHLMDGLADVFVDLIQIMPVADPVSEGSAGHEGQTKSGD